MGGHGGKRTRQRSLFDDVGASPPRGTRPADFPREHATLAGNLPAALRMGTSSWAFPGWRGVVYATDAAKQRLSREGLAAYSKHPLLRTVGVDRTFYAPVESDVLSAYAAQVPADFGFLVKAHEWCTTPRFPASPRYGSQAGRRNEYFLDPRYAAEQVIAPFATGLRDHPAVLLFQFPPFDPGRAGAGGFAERLHRFLTSLPTGPRYAVEIRNPRLLTDEYLAALDDAGVAHCLNVHPTMPPVGEQAARIPAASGPLVVRWMLHGNLGYEQARDRYEPFDRLVDEDPASRGAIAALAVRALEARRDVFVIANNKAEGSAPKTIFALAAAIAAELERSRVSAETSAGHHRNLRRTHEEE